MFGLKATELWVYDQPSFPEISPKSTQSNQILTLNWFGISLY